MALNNDAEFFLESSGEWETMNSDDSVNDASSNVEVVTVRPDVSSIDITTPKARPYKDVSFLRPKKYKSSTNLLPTLKTSSKTNPQSEFEIGNHPDSKGADVQIIPQKANNELLDGEKEEPNDGSLYGKYRDALVSGYEGELTENIGNNNEYINPVEESVRYNPPSFNDEEDNDDVEEAVYSNGDQKFHPKGKRIEEKYVKHNLREERLEGLRTNSFGTSGENEDYQTESDPENQSDSYDSPKYVDDYAAPKPYPDGRKPFRPSPLQNQASEDGGKYLPIRSGYYRGRDENLGSYSDYDYGEDERNNEPSAPRPTGAHFNPTSGLSFQQGKRGPNCSKNGKFARFPNSQKRPRFRGRYQEYPSTFRVEKYGRNPKTAYYDSHGKNAFHKNVGGPYPYAPGHGYSPQSQESPVRFSNGGIRLVEPPQRHNLPRHGRYPRYKKGLALPIRGPPRARGQKISYRHVIPHRDGFTKVVKRYKSFVDYTPKSYIGSGEPYPRP